MKFMLGMKLARGSSGATAGDIPKPTDGAKLPILPGTANGAAAMPELMFGGKFPMTSRIAEGAGDTQKLLCWVRLPIPSNTALGVRTDPELKPFGLIEFTELKSKGTIFGCWAAEPSCPFTHPPMEAGVEVLTSFSVNQGLVLKAGDCGAKSQGTFATNWRFGIRVVWLRSLTNTFVPSKGYGRLVRSCIPAPIDALVLQARRWE